MTQGVYLRLPRNPGGEPSLAVAWSVEHVEILRQLWLEGHSARVIGDRLGRTRNSVIGRVHRLGLPTRLGGKACARQKPKPRAYNPSAFRKSRARPPELRVTRVKPASASAKRWLREVPPPEARMVSLMELQPGDCKWPIGDPAQPGFGFCGAKRFASFCYCQHHVAMAYIPVKARGEARKAPPLHVGMNGSWRQGVAT